LRIVLAVILRPNGSGEGNRTAEPAANVDTGGSAEPEEELEGEAEGRGDAIEAQEESEVTEKRLEALAEAKAAGKFGQKVAATTAPATGWVGSKVLSSTADDWELAVATDPKAPYVYLLTTRYGTRECGTHCPTPFIPITISSDGGSRWSKQVPLCECLRSEAQYDPTIEVVPNTGAVYSAFLNWDRHNGFSTVFTNSTDHGKTWTEPVHVYGNVSWTDKPEITMSASGKHVYVSWNGPQGGDLYVGISHDFGETWTQKKLSDNKRYYYAYDARVLGNGTVIFSESSIVYSGLTKVSGEVWHHGSSRATRARRGKTSSSRRCPRVSSALRRAAGRTSMPGRRRSFPTRQDTSCSPMKGRPQPEVHSAPTSRRPRTEVLPGAPGAALSVAGENATGPRLAFSGGGNVRIWYMQTADGDNPDAWNVWYRTSSNGGSSWSSPVKISDAPSGATGYINDLGEEIYGDYGEIAVTNTGKTVATWGEGFSWIGPGGTWFNIER
jgi:hypothetical protein